MRTNKEWVVNLCNIFIMGTIVFAVVVLLWAVVHMARGTYDIEPYEPYIHAEVVVETPKVVTIESVAVTPVVEDAPEENENEQIEAALYESGYFREDIPLDAELQAMLRAASEEFGVDYFIMVALIDRETDFRNISGDGGDAAGYCQIHERWWSGLMAEIGAKDLYDANDNFRTAAAIIAQHTERYGNIEDALTAYNSGKLGKSAYASDVLAKAEMWRECE